MKQNKRLNWLICDKICKIIEKNYNLNGNLQRWLLVYMCKAISERKEWISFALVLYFFDHI